MTTGPLGTRRKELTARGGGQNMLRKYSYPDHYSRESFRSGNRLREHLGMRETATGGVCRRYEF